MVHFNAGVFGVAAHGFRKKANEIPDAHPRLKDFPATETHFFKGSVNRPDDFLAGVVGVLRTSCGRPYLIIRHDGSEPRNKIFPLRLCP